jgi:surfactin synthase thioesterase subunit
LTPAGLDFALPQHPSRVHAMTWILRRPSRTPPRLRLFCFAHAGSTGVTYLSWQAALGPEVEVCAMHLPGRGSRFAETPRVSMLRLVEELGPVIAGQPELPFVFFGHSLGALLAFELARHAQKCGQPMPQQLIVSGCAAPQRRRPRPRFEDLDDTAFIDALKTYEGTTSELLNNPELMEFALPALRADFKILSDYRYRPGPLLDIPVVALAGRADAHTARSEVEAWQRETTGAFRTRWFDGGHFFIDSARPAVLECVSAELGELACG